MRASDGRNEGEAVDSPTGTQAVIDCKYFIREASALHLLLKDVLVLKVV